MKPVVIFILSLYFCISSTQSVVGQNISGQYYGIGNVTKDGNYSQYLTELILVQKGNSVSGQFNYYFKSSHITAKVKGEFNSNTRLLKLQLIPLLNYKAVNSLGADCPMQGYFVFRVAKVETTLSGEFEAIDAYKYTCPSIFIKLKKEAPTAEEKVFMEIAKAAEAKNKAFDSLVTAKFAPDTTTYVYVEPEEPVKKSTKAIKPAKKRTDRSTNVTAKTNSVKGISKNETIPLPPNEPKQTVQANNKRGNSQNNDSTKLTVVAPKPAVVNPPASKPAAIVKNETQVVEKNLPVVIEEQKPFIDKKAAPNNEPTNLQTEEIALTADLLKRTFEESTVIEVEADSLFIELYDNGEVDGDTVAVFFNRKLLASKQRLGTTPIKLALPIDTTTEEISMYAENLGHIPPNTAICIITAGGKRYELTLTSTFIRNGTIRFRKKTQAQIEQEKKYL